MILHLFTPAALALLLLQACSSEEPKPTPPVQDPPAAGLDQALTMTVPSEQLQVRLQHQFPSTVRVGDPLIQVLTVKNIWSGAVENVVIRERLPKAFKLDPGSGGEIRDGTAEWKLGSLKAGESKTVTLKGTATEPGDLMMCPRVTFEPALCGSVKVVAAEQPPAR